MSTPLAVIDIGTNSVKLLVASVADGRVHPRHFVRATTRLGEGLDGRKRISAEAAARTARAVRSLAAEARRHGAARVTAVGTYALRTAHNGAEVARGIARAAGIEVRVLTGQEEARLAFLSARTCFGHDPGPILVLDVGGGSAQLAAGRGTALLAVHSLPLGALRLTERHLHHDPIDRAEYERMKQEIDRVLLPAVNDCLMLAPRAAFVAVGGSATTALAMARRDRGGRNRDGALRMPDLHRIERACLARSIAERRSMPGLPPDRADIIPAGIAVVLACMRAARKRVVTVTGGGVREGALLAMARES